MSKTGFLFKNSRPISNSTKTTRSSDPFLEALAGQLLGSFDTDISNAASVLQLGFPAKWNPCTLREIYPFTSNSSSQLEIVVVGGSSTAHSSSRCNPTGGRFGGRYTNLLQRDLDNDMRNSSITFNIVNVGHGNTDSLWNSFMLDELINPSTTDVLIWEYATNDALGGTTGHPYRTPEHCRAMLNLWFWRVARIFAEVGRPPPPLIMVYLWDANFEEQKTFKAVGQTAIQAQIEVIEFYRQQGWSIEVLNVGGVVNVEQLARGFFQLLDDAHHPNCLGMKLISAMIRQTLYSDLATCGDASLLTTKPSKHLLTPMLNTNQSILLNFLLAGNTRIGSVMEWTPQQGTSSLRIDHDAKVSSSVQATAGSKAAATRGDRKLSYTLPPCPTRLEFTLFEPTLEYIGAGYGGGDYFSNPYNGQVEMVVNGIQINSTSTVMDGLDFDLLKFMSLWLHVPTNIPPADQYTVSFCKKATPEAECIFKNATTVEEVCPIWYALKNTSSCPLEYAGAPDVTTACINYFFSPEGREMEKKYGSWVGAWGKGDPQINWLVGVMQS